MNLNDNKMRFKDANPYYSPEKCGLEIFNSIDTGESYEFDMLVIWKKLDNGTLWWDTDSGCSCPTPFDYSPMSHDLKQITDDTFYSFSQALENHYKIDRKTIIEIMTKVKEYLNL